MDGQVEMRGGLVRRFGVGAIFRPVVGLVWGSTRGIDFQWFATGLCRIRGVGVIGAGGVGGMARRLRRRCAALRLPRARLAGLAPAARAGGRARAASPPSSVAAATCPHGVPSGDPFVGSLGYPPHPHPVLVILKYK